LKIAILYLRSSILDQNFLVHGGKTMAGPGACYNETDRKRESIYHQVKEFLDKGETLAVATIVSTKGSTPREVGAKMVVTAWGEILGTIGGGCGEADVKREAIEVIRTRRPRTVRVDLLDDISSDSPAVCGGIMNVFIDPWWKERDQEITQQK
jgi:xanthine/CO dehydrogenase XdhC/CoxF family maturation factor